MTQDNASQQVPVPGLAMQGFLMRLMSVQEEMLKEMIEANQHAMEQARLEWSGALELGRKLAGNDPAADKVTAVQEWLKGTSERILSELKYAAETARTIGKIEMKLFTPDPDQSDQGTRAFR